MLWFCIIHDKTRKEAPISTHVIWLFSGPKNESSHTRCVENVVLTRVS
ncbi:unnamed protein product [Brassica rapa subsp. trilocularis]